MSKVINFQDFMTGEYKAKEKAKRKRRIEKTTKLASAALLPLATCGAVGSFGFAMKAFAMTAGSNAVVASTTPIAVEVGAKAWMSEQTLSALAHVLDPVVDVLVALSLPIASVIIVGSCFFFMMGNSEKAWTSIQNASLGYVLIQVSPLILNVLKQVGNAV
jgi:nitrate reductase NapE component